MEEISYSTPATMLSHVQYNHLDPLQDLVIIFVSIWSYGHLTSFEVSTSPYNPAEIIQLARYFSQLHYVVAFLFITKTIILHLALVAQLEAAI